MIKRSVEISSGPAHLAVRYGQLVVRREGEDDAQVPIEDLGVLVVEHPAVTYTHSLLTTLALGNVAVVFCGQDHQPAGMLLPFEGNTFQAQAVAAQADAKDAVKNRLWAEIVRAKVRAQGRLLAHVGEESGAFGELADRVKSGDPQNVEAQAAQRYWRLLLGDGFRRGRAGAPPNNLLNYAYMVLRAAVGRAICGAGLHPSLGLHHQNKYNAFGLADDLMEPLRPAADARVRALWHRGEREITKETKKELIETLSAPVEWTDKRSPLQVSLHRYAASLREALSGNAKGLDIPKPVFGKEEGPP